MSGESRIETIQITTIRGEHEKERLAKNIEYP